MSAPLENLLRDARIDLVLARIEKDSSIEKDAAGAQAGQAAQDAQNDASAKDVEEADFEVVDDDKK